MKKYSAFLFCLFFVKIIFGQADSIPTVFEHFLSDDTIHINVEADMRSLIRKKHSTDWLEGKLSWKNKSGENENWDIEIRTRGNMRKDICFFPPLKIKFSKKQKKAAGLGGSRKIKIVSSCKSMSQMEQYVLREHLIYKMLNEITEVSFRVQLVKFTFWDNSGSRDPFDTFGFFIEDIGDVADRLNAAELAPKIMSPRGIESHSLATMSVFQYAISNTDWYVYNNHNLKFLQMTESRQIKVIPYDFDYAGIVSTSYSAPSPGIPISSVSERIYVGNCMEPEEWEVIFQPFRDAKKKWMALVENDAFLNSKSKKIMSKYIRKFYGILENEKKTRRKITEACGLYMKRSFD